MTTTIASAGTEGAVDELLISRRLPRHGAPATCGRHACRRDFATRRQRSREFPTSRSRGGWDPTETAEGDGRRRAYASRCSYATRGMTLFRIEDVPLQEACVRAFNDWLIEYCAVSPRATVRHRGSSRCMTSTTRSRNWKRCRNAGLRGAMVWQNPPEGLPFSSDRYDPFWAAAAGPPDAREPAHPPPATGTCSGPPQRDRALPRQRESQDRGGDEQPVRHHLLPGAGPLPQPQDRARGERDRLDPVHTAAVGLLPGQAPAP